MAGFVPSKMKRKDLEEVYDDFSEFSLSSPARKIRRLDAELPPIMEEEERAVPLVFEQPIPEERIDSNIDMPELESMMTDAAIGVPFNEERALVLYKPVENPLVLSLSSLNASFRVSSDVISGIKNHVFWPSNPNPRNSTEELPQDDNKAASTNNCLAMVAWQAPITSQMTGDAESRSGLSEELMDADVEEGVSMEVEEILPSSAAGVGGEGFHQWPQHHCMAAELPPNPSTPIMWS